MSINITNISRKGVTLSSSLMGDKASLGFEDNLARAIAAQYRDMVAKDPIIQSIKVVNCVDGRANNFAMMLGLLDTVPADFAVYPMENFDAEWGSVDLWIDRSVEGEIRIAYCSQDSRKLEHEDTSGAIISSLRFPAEDLDEFLEILGADRSGEEDEE